MFKTHDLGRVLGVQLKLHGSVFLLVAVLAGLSLLSSGLAAAFSVVVLLAMVLGSVTLHELGHIGVARLFGNHTDGITLYPFGGVAQLARPSRTAREEILVALAGPGVNVLLASLTALPLFTLGEALGPLAGLLTDFLWVNVGLALFNLVPAYPMDGGRVLRGALWPRLGQVEATYWAARGGQAFAVLFALLSVVWSPMLLVVAAFVFFHATAELQQLRPLREAQRARRAAAPVHDPRPHLGGRGVNQPRPWSSDPWGDRMVVVHTPSGSFREVVLADGRRFRQYL